MITKKNLLDILLSFRVSTILFWILLCIHFVRGIRLPDRAKFLIDRKIALLKSLDLLDDGTMQTAVKWMGPVFFYKYLPICIQFG